MNWLDFFLGGQDLIFIKEVETEFPNNIIMIYWFIVFQVEKKVSELSVNMTGVAGLATSTLRNQL